MFETIDLYILIMGLIFTFLPSLLLSIFLNSNKAFIGSFACFSAIAVFYSLLPEWFLAVSILSLSVLLYEIIRGQELL